MLLRTGIARNSYRVLCFVTSGHHSEGRKLDATSTTMSNSARIRPYDTAPKGCGNPTLLHSICACFHPLLLANQPNMRHVSQKVEDRHSDVQEISVSASRMILLPKPPSVHSKIAQNPVQAHPDSVLGTVRVNESQIDLSRKRPATASMPLSDFDLCRCSRTTKRIRGSGTLQSPLDLDGTCQPEYVLPPRYSRGFLLRDAYNRTVGAVLQTDGKPGR
eukprot:2171045-Rhodomonas_salina.2